MNHLKQDFNSDMLTQMDNLPKKTTTLEVENVAVISVGFLVDFRCRQLFWFHPIPSAAVLQWFHSFLSGWEFVIQHIMVFFKGYRMHPLGKVICTFKTDTQLILAIQFQEST